MTAHVLPRKRRGVLAHRLAPAVLLLPAVLLVLIALGYPLMRQVIMSFQEFGLAQQFGQAPAWVGLDNYLTILTDPYFWTVLGRSIVFCLWTAAWTMGIGLGLALLMTGASKLGRTTMSVSLVIVWAMPLLAALTVWQWLVDPNFGLVNFLLTSLGLDGFAGFSWLADSPLTFFLVASAVIIWVSTPLVTITIFASLTQVDGSLLEASQLDGATYLGRLRHIVLPIIFPVVALMGVLQIIWDLRVFTHIHVLQASGGVTTETNLLGTYVFQVGVSQGDYGVASALAMVILALSLVMTAAYIRMLLTQEDPA
jgi:N,N'-diacetylchitobiose transport system permease protein